MKSRAIHLTALLFIACSARSLAAGTIIQQSEFEPGDANARQKVTIYVDAGKLRLEGANLTSEKYLLIFDGSKQVTWMIDPAKGSYYEFTKEQIEQIANQMQGVATQMQAMMKQMDAQMANMPPEQRAMMEQMMKSRMGGMAGAAPPPAAKTVRQKATGEKVGQFTCTRYEIMTGDQLTQEVCAAPPSSLQMDASAMETFKAMAKFYEPIARLASSVSTNWAAPTGMDQIQGFPVQTIIYFNQKPTADWRIESIETRSVEASLFELPPGLKKVALPQMSPMPPGR
jgi:Domain of unknown function (DUF4412)